MKFHNNLSVLLVLSILSGLLGAIQPVVVTAMATSPKLSVFELVTSPT